MNLFNLLFPVVGLLYLCCLVCWAGGLLYSLFFDRRRRRWLTPVLAVIGLALSLHCSSLHSLRMILLPA